MKDFRVTFGKKTMYDLVPVVKDNAVQFLSVESEQKLVQSLVKLLLTPIEEHIFGYGIDHGNISEDEIMNAFRYYNEVTETTDPSEIIDTVGIRQISFDEFEIILTTAKGTELSFIIGI